MEVRLHALNRLGLGAPVGERRTISDPRGWLRGQLDRVFPGSAGVRPAWDLMS